MSYTIIPSNTEVSNRFLIVIFYVNGVVTQKKIYRDVSMMWFTAEQLRACVDGQRLSDMRERYDRDRGPV